MKGKHEHITAFYIETILLIVSFVLVILVLTNVFGLGKRESSKAQDLTNAVRLAESAAEAFAAAEGPAELAQLLDGLDTELGSVPESLDFAVNDRSHAIFVYYDKDLNPVEAEDPYGYNLHILWTPNPVGTGTMADALIYVTTGYWDKETVYELRTARYIQEVQP